jgi:hypothetical protein
LAQGRVKTVSTRAASLDARNNKALVFLRGLRFVWCGTRRTVVVGGARFSAGLEFGRKFGVPLLVTINKSASYGTQWNRTGASLTSSNLFKLSLT